MILENYSGNAAALTEGVGSFTGEPSELMENAMEAMASVHNLSIAMARVEHKCIVEATSPEALTEAIGPAVKEYFSRIKNAIVTYWKKFVNWVKSAFESMRNRVFGPRKKWLDEHKAELEKANSFGDAEYSFGKNISNGKIGSAMGDAQSHADAALKEATAWAGGEGKPEDLKHKVMGLFTDGKAGAEVSVSKALEEVFIGEEASVKIDRSGVSKMIGVAEAAFKAGAELPQAQRIAAAYITLADAQERVGQSSVDKNDEAAKKAAARRLEGLQVIGPVVQSAIGAYVSVIGKVNQQAMGYLVKAASAARSGAIDKEGAAKPHIPVGGAAKNEGGSLLAAFM